MNKKINNKNGVGRSSKSQAKNKSRSYINKKISSAPKLLIKELDKHMEAVLLASGEPISVRQFQAIFTEEEVINKGEEAGKNNQYVGSKEIQGALKRLQKKYENSVMQLVKGASGYIFHINKDYAASIQSFQQEKPARYSRALMETLAVIAYKQPVTKAEIEDLRGVTLSSGIMRTLQEHEWIKILGHKEVPGRPAIWGTTKVFLDNFKLSGLKDLPPLEASSLDEETSNHQEESKQIKKDADSHNDAMNIKTTNTQTNSNDDNNPNKMN